MNFCIVLLESDGDNQRLVWACCETVKLSEYLALERKQRISNILTIMNHELQIFDSNFVQNDYSIHASFQPIPV
jgi:hypothetical protein